MRLRNVKGANEIIESSNYVVLNYKEHKGKYNKLFGNDNPIHVEIGMGKGKFIIDNALKYPNINFIGIEKYDSVVVRAIQKLDNKDIPNLKIIRMDALEIDDVFDHEISKIYLNFSDPWPKDRHAHRRLSSEIFLKKYDTIFKNSKNIIMKTDNRKLFEYSLKSLIDYGYKINDISLDLHGDIYPDNIMTEYEEKFVSKGNQIYMVDVTK